MSRIWIFINESIGNWRILDSEKLKNYTLKEMSKNNMTN